MMRVAPPSPRSLIQPIIVRAAVEVRSLRRRWLAECERQRSEIAQAIMDYERGVR